MDQKTCMYGVYSSNDHIMRKHELYCYITIDYFKILWYEDMYFDFY